MISPTDTYLASQQAAHGSGVSWAAVFAGAAAAIIISMLLVLLGLGLGFSAVSPWMEEGMSATRLGVSGIIWLIVTQIIASGIGGYMAGRLRGLWVGVHGDEIHFRDTAHGFLAWAVATLLAMTLIVGSASSVISGGVRAGASVASGAASGAVQAASGMLGSASGQDYGYFIDNLLRSDRPADLNDEQAHAMALRIFTRTLGNQGQISPEDRSYLAQLVSQRTGMSPPEAERRVDQVHAQAVKSLDDARNTALHAADTATRVAARGALWTFVTLLCGAFFASLAALYGGRRRDAGHLVNTTAATAAASH